MFVVTDTITNIRTITDDLYGTIRGLFLSNDNQIITTITELVRKIEHGDDATAESAWLGVRVETL